jgi:hypothetical protein
MTGAAAWFSLTVGLLFYAGQIDLPSRPPAAPTGPEFARSVENMPLKEREEQVLAELKAGNVPAFWREFVPVTVSHGSDTATYWVAPDYLAIGSDDDYFLVPLSPYTAQKIADRLGCCLPTTKIVDDVYAAAEVKLAPAPIPPSPAMTTVPVFLNHNALVLAARKGKPLGVLVAGHKKDVVIANKVFAAPGKVAIYGWHKLDGKPIQPLYTGHTAAWVDYSHGIRLVQRRMKANGQGTTIDRVLADPKLAPLLSNEGVMTQTRYAIDTAPTDIPAAALVPAQGEAIDVLTFEPGVRIVINRPEAPAAHPVLLVFYALPNGNTIEQTIGKAPKPGDDWHFDIQHIGAQTRFLREKIRDRTIVVAYLENSMKSWPAWRKANGDSRIPALLDCVRDRFDRSQTRLVLNGHSGGGSLIFGYLNCVDEVPDVVERIAFLDSNYAYETDRHAQKLASWLKDSDRHFLAVFAYNDAIALLDGKTFVTPSGGTWGRSHAMLTDLERSFALARELTGDVERHRALEGRIAFFLKDNPEQKVLHTIQVERNGFIESILSGTPLEEVGYKYFGDRAYANFIK